MINRLEVKRRGFAPQARIAATVNEATVNFSDGHSRSPFGAITSWVWSFGDGQFATGPEATHTYGRTGFFEVLLMVVDSTGRRASTTKRVWVTVPNSAPTAAFFTSGTGLTVNFDASSSSDTDGSIVSYAWEFGDNATGTGATASHEYAAAGTYNVKLTVTDDRGATGTVIRTVTVVEPIIYGPSPLGSAGAVALDPSDAIHLPSGMASAGVVTLSPPSTVVAPSRLGSAGTTVLEEPEGSFMPRRFATLDEAKTALNLPTDATYITWDAAAAQTG